MTLPVQIDPLKERFCPFKLFKNAFLWQKEVVDIFFAFVLLTVSMNMINYKSGVLFLDTVKSICF